MDNRKRTTIIKRHMRNKYGIKATVRYSSFSMGDSLNVDWIGGPPSALVKQDFAGITKGSFNGMIDLYEYEPGSGPTIEGAVLPRVKYFDATRELTPEFLLRAAIFLSGLEKFGDMHECFTEEDYMKNFDSPVASCWNWQQFIRNALRNAHFVTSDLDAVELLDVSPSRGGVWEYGFVYAFAGKVYSTNDYPGDDWHNPAPWPIRQRELKERLGV